MQNKHRIMEDLALQAEITANERAEQRQPINEKIPERLNFGCGERLLPGYLNADIIAGRGVTRFDFNKVPYPFKANTFKEIQCHHVLEHLSDTIGVMRELYRISAPGCKLFITVPHYHNANAYTDPQHVKYFTTETFEHLTGQHPMSYYTSTGFKLVKIEIVPTWLGRVIPGQKLLKLASKIFGELAADIKVELEAQK